MGWLVALMGVVFAVILTRKSVDRETTRNIKKIAKAGSFFVAGLIVLLVLSYLAGQ